MVFNLVFASDTILLFLIFFFLVLWFLIPGVITKLFIVIAELAVPTKIQQKIKEEKLKHIQ